MNSKYDFSHFIEELGKLEIRFLVVNIFNAVNIFK